MFILGFLGVVGSIMYGMITGGGIGPFLHGGAALFVFATSFFAGLAMSKGEFNEKVISNTGDAAVLIGWIGFIIGITLLLRTIFNSSRMVLTTKGRGRPHSFTASRMVSTPGIARSLFFAFAII